MLMLQHWWARTETSAADFLVNLLKLHYVTAWKSWFWGLLEKLESTNHLQKKHFFRIWLLVFYHCAIENSYMHNRAIETKKFLLLLLLIIIIINIYDNNIYQNLWLTSILIIFSSDRITSC